MEFNIAVCDDEEQHARHIKMLADRWAHESGIKTNTAMFESAENFKAALAKGQRFDCLLLDIQMDGQNGVELAKELRKTDGRLFPAFLFAFEYSRGRWRAENLSEVL